MRLRLGCAHSGPGCIASNSVIWIWSNCFSDRRVSGKPCGTMTSLNTTRASLKVYLSFFFFAFFRLGALEVFPSDLWRLCEDVRSLACSILVFVVVSSSYGGSMRAPVTRSALVANMLPVFFGSIYSERLSLGTRNSLYAEFWKCSLS